MPLSIPINVICFSNGDAQGLGEKRQHELQSSIHALIQNQRQTNVTVLHFQDGNDQIWDIDQMTQYLPQNDHQAFLTFDSHGVSGHKNHIACHNAVWNLKNTNNNVTILTLDSIHHSLLAKYTFFIIDLVKLYWNLWKDQQQPQWESHDKITFFNAYSQYILAYSTMLNAHKSQVVWFRYGWWAFSRFVFSNHLKITT